MLRMERKSKPTCCLLYLTVPLMIALLLADARMPYPLVVHRVAEFATVIVSFGLMALWVKANETALINEEMEKERWILRPDESEDCPASDVPSSVDDCEESEAGAYSIEASPTKGRYN